MVTFEDVTKGRHGGSWLVWVTVAKVRKVVMPMSRKKFGGGGALLS